ncbi:hypothetical protein CTI14_13850 [Methylobacterium radiotolerans]|nr:hypothetical protein CTI14_13850 [Methylobacterium radiotolerans]
MNVFGLMIPDAVVDVAVLVLILLGAILCLSASVGLLHFRDVPTRLHAATKPQVLGLLLICVAIALSQRSIGRRAVRPRPHPARGDPLPLRLRGAPALP